MVRKLAFYMACLISIVFVQSCAPNHHSISGQGSTLSITSPNNGVSFRTKEKDSFIISGICDKGVDVALSTVPARPVTNNCATDGTWSFESGTLSSGPNTFSISNETAHVSLTAIADLAYSMEIRADHSSINVGGFANIHAAFFDMDGAEIIVPPTSPHGLTWLNDNPDVATLSPVTPPTSGEKVLLTAGSSPGFVTLHVSLDQMDPAYNYTGNTTADITLEVTNAPAAIPGVATSMAIRADKTEIDAGDIANLHVVFYDINGAEIMIPEVITDHLITWDSDYPLIAKVDPASSPTSGEKAIVTGVSGGDANITATLSIGGYYASLDGTTANITISVNGDINLCAAVKCAAGFACNPMTGQCESTDYSQYGTSDFTTITNIGRHPSQDALQAVAVQSDGKIVATGSTYYNGSNATNAYFIIRYNSNGTVDNDFGVNGKVVYNSINYFTSIAVQPNDGKIVAAGYYYNSDTGVEDFVLVRYDTFGNLDTAFGSNGKAVTEIVGQNAVVTSIAIQTDGKIVLAGRAYYNPYNGIFSDFALVRYNVDGSLDTAFGTSGIVLTDLGSNSDDYPYSIAIQPDGQILVAGTCVANGSEDFALVRYNSSDGSLDSSFGTNGIVLTAIGSGSYGEAHSIAIQSDGKIVVVGDSYDTNAKWDFALVRYNADGTLDPAFGTSGIVTTDVGSNSQDGAYFTAIQSNGKIVVTGFSTVNDPNGDFALARYNADGTLDTTFGTNGITLTDIGGNSDYPNSAAIQTDGKVIVVGASSYDIDNINFSNAVLIRYTVDGSLDNTFGTQGEVISNSGANSSDDANSVAVQSDGKIVVAGYSDVSGPGGGFALARYNSDGALDNGFGINGKVTTNIPGGIGSWAASVAVQSDGKIVAAGMSDISSDPNGPIIDFAVVRYNNDGSLDNGFGTNGIVTTDIGEGGNDQVKAMAIQRDGKIVVAGSSYSSNASHPNWDFALVRYNSNGTLDNTFGASGIVLTNIGTMTIFGCVHIPGHPGCIPMQALVGSDDEARSIIIQPDGKIVAAGSSNTGSSGGPGVFGSSSFALVRYNGDGSLDDSFGTNGIVTTNVGQWGGANSVAMQANGKIVAAGSSTAVAGNDENFTLVRYNRNGTVDSSFGIVYTDIGNSSEDELYSVAIQPDGKIVAAGYSAAIGSDGGFAFVRYNTDATLDNTFGTNGIYLPSLGISVGGAYSVAIQPNGKIVGAGYGYIDINGDSDFVVTRF